jgi:hypothetical protein
MAPGASNKDTSEWITVKRRSARPTTETAEQKGLQSSGSHTKADSDSFADSASTQTSAHASRSASPSADENRRPKKAKKQKTAPRDVPLSADAVVSAVQDAQEYSDDATTQIGLITDFVINHYRDSELAFNKLVLDQPLHKARSAAALHMHALPRMHDACISG